MDILFSYDTTGSMSSVIQEVRHQLQATAIELFRSIPELRIGAIAHGDYCDCHSTYVFKTLDFTDNLNDILHFFANAGNTNGGDHAECYELILEVAKSMLYGKDGVFVMIGDAVPHSQEESARQILKYNVATAYVNGVDWRESAYGFSVPIYTIQCLHTLHSRNSFWAELASITNGYHLRLDQFSDIVQTMAAIAYRQVGQERVQEYADGLIELGRFNRGMASIIDTLLEEPAKFSPMTWTYKPVAMGRYGRGIKPVPDGLIAVYPGRFQVMTVGRADISIKDFVRKNGFEFEIGKGFYQLTKPVLVQERKEVIVQDRDTGDLFSGKDARHIIGLPYGDRGTVHSRDIRGNWNVFIQSTSANRKLIANTKFLYDLS